MNVNQKVYDLIDSLYLINKQKNRTILKELILDNTAVKLEYNLIHTSGEELNKAITEAFRELKTMELLDD